MRSYELEQHIDVDTLGATIFNEYMQDNHPDLYESHESSSQVEKYIDMYANSGIDQNDLVPGEIYAPMNFQFMAPMNMCLIFHSDPIECMYQGKNGNSLSFKTKTGESANFPSKNGENGGRNFLILVFANEYDVESQVLSAKMAFSGWKVLMKDIVGSSKV